MGDRDAWSEADLAARAVAKGVLRDDALLRKNVKEIGCDVVSEWAIKVARRLSMAQMTARGPGEDGKEITGTGGKDESFVAFNACVSRRNSGSPLLRLKFAVVHR
jgi:hypothetical protein